MQEEAGYRKTGADVFVRHTSAAPADVSYTDRQHPHERMASGSSSSLPSYHSPSPRVAKLTGPWAVLGERLNLEKEEVRELITMNAAKYAMREDVEMPFGGRAY